MREKERLWWVERRPKMRKREREREERGREMREREMKMKKMPMVELLRSTIIHSPPRNVTNQIFSCKFPS